MVDNQRVRTQKRPVFMVFSMAGAEGEFEPHALASASPLKLGTASPTSQQTSQRRNWAELIDPSKQLQENGLV